MVQRKWHCENGTGKNGTGNKAFRPNAHLLDIPHALINIIHNIQYYYYN